MIRKIREASPVEKRLNFLLLIVAISGIISIAGATEISKGAQLLTLNYQHVAGERDLSGMIDDLTEDVFASRVSHIVEQIMYIREQPVQCLQMLNGFDRAVLKIIGAARVIELCRQDIILADRTIINLQSWSPSRMPATAIIDELETASRRFRANSDEFQPLVVSSERVIFYVIIVSLIIKAIIVPLVGIYLSRLISRDYDRLKTAEASVREARDKAIEAAETREKFLATLSHELRTPLNPILGMSEMLMNDNIAIHTDTAKEYVTQIHRSANHLLSILQKTFDWERLRRGEFSPDLKPVDLGGIINECVTEQSDKLVEKELRIETHIETDPVVVGDPTAVQQILSNLVSNSVKFCGAGARIMIFVRALDKEVILDVEDEGPGISEEHLPRVTQAFYKSSDNHTAPKDDGIGLGLSLVALLVKVCDARLWIENRAEGGTRVRIYFKKAHAGL